jgi:hypothetical protein
MIDGKDIVYPDVGSVWKHHRVGTLYRVIDITNTHSINPHKYPVMVSYQRLNDGTKWSRPLYSWVIAYTLVPGDEWYDPVGPGTEGNDYALAMLEAENRKLREALDEVIVKTTRKMKQAGFPLNMTFDEVWDEVLEVYLVNSSTLLS